jgi:hypothetical protein
MAVTNENTSLISLIDGLSVTKNASGIKNVCRIAQERRTETKIVVISAPTKVMKMQQMADSQVGTLSWRCRH